MDKKQQPKRQNPNAARASSPNQTGNVLKTQALIVFGFAMLLYANTTWNEYAVDDTIVITKNTLTTQGLKGIPKIMTTDAFYGFFGEGYKLVEGGRYRPLSIVTFAIEYEFLGLNPHFSHFINILLFALSGVLIFYLFVELLQTLFQGTNIWQWNIPFLTIPFTPRPWQISKAGMK